MPKVIVVFGAGTGLGVSVARRFGREGFRVALVARRRERLDLLAAQLANEGIEAIGFTADLSDPHRVPALIDAIHDRFGRIDVVEYGPASGDQPFTAATELDAATLERLARLFLFTPVEIIHAVLPEMTSRGDGAVLLTHGYSALQPMPYLSGLGPVMSAARNYLYSLAGELTDTGVYAGTLTIAAAIERSEMAEAATAAADTDGALAELLGFELTSVNPDDLAAYYWDMYTKRDRVEQIHPANLAPQPST